jgi:hypothetical protein
VVEVSSGDMPYSDCCHYNNSFIRVFDQNTANEEYVWHRDRADRLVEVISGEGWMFQHDNNVPFEMQRGMTINIEAYSYHRILKGNTDLVLRITEKVGET